MLILYLVYSQFSANSSNVRVAQVELWGSTLTIPQEIHVTDHIPTNDPPHTPYFFFLDVFILRLSCVLRPSILT